MGRQWREMVGEILTDAGLRPRVVVLERGTRENYIESLVWRKGGQCCIALVKNGAYQAGVAGFAGMEVTGIGGEPTDIEVRISDLTYRQITNLRTGKSFGGARTFRDRFNPWEANLYLAE